MKKLIILMVALNLGGFLSVAYANEWYESMESSTIDYSSQASKQTHTPVSGDLAPAPVLSRAEIVNDIQASIQTETRKLVFQASERPNLPLMSITPAAGANDGGSGTTTVNTPPPSPSPSYGVMGGKASTAGG